MINRVTSFHKYQALTQTLMSKQGSINQTNEQLASGLRVQTAGDDPMASISIQNFDQQLTEINQYLSGINLANNRLGRMETSLTQAENLVDSSKQTVLGMINGAVANNDRSMFKSELQSLYDGLVNVGNEQDESGRYIFSGTQDQTRPFVADAQGNTNYQGNNEQKVTQIDDHAQVTVNQTGQEVFMALDNPLGDYRPNYQGLSTGSELHLVSATTSNHPSPDDYRIAFVETNNELHYQLYQGQSTTPLSAQKYEPDVGIQYQNNTVTPELELDFQLNGTAHIGDEITLNPQDTMDVFSALQQAIKYADYPTDSAEANAELQLAITDLSASFMHLNQQRADIGSEMKTLDTYENQHQDYELTLNKAQSSLKDLDYGEAVLRLNQDMMALKASQMAFNQTKNLSLFDFL